MRSLLLGTLTLAFIASVSAKFDFGLCPSAEKPRVTWTNYVKTASNHRIGAID
jgi:hypothetical protein